jgi:hypothetical protein
MKSHIVFGAGLIGCSILMGLTAFVGVMCLFLGIGSLGIIDYLMFPGAIIGWTCIWGDNFNNSAAERMTEIGISLATNGAAGFIMGIFAGTVLRLRKKKRVDNSGGP